MIQTHEKTHNQNYQKLFEYFFKNSPAGMNENYLFGMNYNYLGMK